MSVYSPVRISLSTVRKIRYENIRFFIERKACVLFLTTLISFLGLSCFLPKVIQHFKIHLIILSMLVYAASHVFRAARLSIISSSLLKTSARTTFWLQLSIIPFTILPPLKAGEIVLLYNLWLISNNFAESILTIIIDRLFDAIILCFFLFFALHYNELNGVMNSILRFTQWMIIAVTLTAGICLIIGPGALESLQRYILVNHLGSHTRPFLYIIDLFRSSISSGNALLLRKGAYLMMLSLLIWGLEFLSTFFLTSFAIAPHFHNADLLLMSRAASEWHAATAAHIDPSLSIAAQSSIVVVLIMFPLAAYKYLNRISMRKNKIRG